MKDKNSKAGLNGFAEIVNESNGKPNKLCWSGRELYNELMQ